MRVLGAIFERYPPPADCKTESVSIHLLERRQRVAVPIEEAFAFYGDALNLQPLTPPWLHFRMTTPGEVSFRAGTLLDYRLKLHGVPVRWRTRIETWEPPLRFVDTQVKGPYALWEHTHLFTNDGEGATDIHDRIRYEMPLGVLGALAHVTFVRRDLEQIFDFRRDAVAQRLVAQIAGRSACAIRGPRLRSRSRQRPAAVVWIMADPPLAVNPPAFTAPSVIKALERSSETLLSVISITFPISRIDSSSMKYRARMSLCRIGRKAMASARFIP